MIACWLSCMQREEQGSCAASGMSPQSTATYGLAPACETPLLSMIRLMCIWKRTGLWLQVVADLEDTFLPMPDDLVVNLVESRAVVEALLDSLPQMFAGNSTVRLPAGSPHLSILADAIG